MSEEIKSANFKGEIKIGELRIPCYVLEDSTRILSGRGVTGSMGLKGRGQGMARFLASKSLIPFISNELRVAIEKPILFKVGKSKKPYLGYEASILPEICKAVLNAEEANALPPHQRHMAAQAKILIAALAVTGIIALVDEATGFQEVRDRKALQAILDKYLLKEYAQWAKRFPDEFYEQMFRLKGWQWKGMKVNRPSVVGKYTNDLVYERLAPRLLPELRRLNPPNEYGRRKVRHQQWLTEDIGHPALQRHLAMLVGFERASSNWNMFYRLVQRALPKYGDTIPLRFDDEDADKD